MRRYDPTFDHKIIVGHCDQWSSDFAIYLEDNLMYEDYFFWYYESAWPKVWPQNKYRSLWPIFHGPVMLRYIFKTFWYINIILCDYGSVWPDVWPQNKRRSVWPIFHGPVILSYISTTFCCMSVIFSDNETVWPKLPPSKYVNMICFHGLVILLNIFKIIWWMNIIVRIMDQCDTLTDLPSICRSVTYILWSSDFASYLGRLFDGKILNFG